MELLRTLLNHPAVDLVAATSRAEAGKRLDEVFPRFTKARSADLTFCEPDPDHIAATGAEVAFLALPHGVAAEIAESHAGARYQSHRSQRRFPPQLP